MGEADWLRAQDAWIKRALGAEAQRDALMKALEFYADENRYRGSNQRNDGSDPYTKSDAAYMQDVNRDNGEIARTALASVAITRNQRIQNEQRHGLPERAKTRPYR